MPGWVYERTHSYTDWPARRCTVHEAYEMHHSCAGGTGEPLGYCAAWPGDYVEREVTYMDKAWMHKDPTCMFEDDPTAPNEDDDE